MTLPDLIANYDWKNVSEIYLDGNPWVCDCHTLWLKYWMQSFGTKLANHQKIICAYPSFNAGKPLMYLADNLFLCWWMVVLSVVGPTLLILIMVSILVAWRWRFWLYLHYELHPFDRDECARENKVYDVFVSYSNDDDEWARDLMKQLENCGYKLCCHELDFEVGRPIAYNVEKAIEESKRTICVLSRNYCQSDICLYEFNSAMNNDMWVNKHRLIMILLDEMPIAEMSEPIRVCIKRYTYLKGNSPFFLKRLRYPESILECLEMLLYCC